MGRRRSASILVACATVVFVCTAAPAGAVRPAYPRACGNAWTVSSQPALTGSGQLNAAAASSATDAWAVGGAFDPATETGDTLIEHHDGTSWSIVPSADGPGSDQSSLNDVVALAPDDAWAVGSFAGPTGRFRPLIEHWDGTSWTLVPSPTGGARPSGLESVGAAGPDDVWAVGSSGQGSPGRTLTEHWDGAAWTIVPSPNEGPFPNGLAAVAVVEPDDAWAVGSWFTKGFVDRTLTLHWDGSSWTRVKSPNAGPHENDLVSVAALAPDDVWAVGHAGLKTLAEHWDGSAWSVVASPTPGGNADLASVVTVGSTDMWAVGGRVDRSANALRTLVEHWNGSAWRVVRSANEGTSDNHLWGVSAAAGRLFAVGSRFHGKRLVPLVLERCGT